MNDKGEAYVVWLTRVEDTSPNPAARQAARLDRLTYAAFEAASKRRVRRSGWDLAAGVHGPIAGTHNAQVQLAGVFFVFHIFAEACDRRGVARPYRCIVTGVPVLGHRVPQVARHGSRFLRS